MLFYVYTTRNSTDCNNCSFRTRYRTIRNISKLARYLTVSLDNRKPQIPQIKQKTHISHFPFLPTPTTPKTQRPKSSKKPEAPHFPFPVFTHPSDPISQMNERYKNMHFFRSVQNTKSSEHLVLVELRYGMAVRYISYSRTT